MSAMNKIQLIAALLRDYKQSTPKATESDVRCLEFQLHNFDLRTIQGMARKARLYGK